MTSVRWEDRVLGVNRTVDMPLCLTWFATGNNIALTGDMPQRIVHIRLQTDLERPDTRQGFRHEDLLDYALKNRQQLVMAALSIPAGYIKAGRPNQHLSPWGSFEGWSALVRGASVWAGLPDCDTREELIDVADEDTEVLSQLLDAWAQLPAPMRWPPPSHSLRPVPLPRSLHRNWPPCLTPLRATSGTLWGNC